MELVITVATILLFSVHLGSSGVFKQPSPECAQEELLKCLTILRRVTQSDNLALPASKDELLLVCQELRDGSRCVDDHMTRCSWGTPEKLFHDVVNGSRQVIQELCLPGAMQEGYLKYAECFKKVSLHENKCAPKYRTLTELFQKQLHDTDEDVNRGRKEWCCSYSDFINCQYTHVTNECGIKAGIFLRSHTDRMSSPLIHEHCPLYIHGSEACISSAVARCVNIWNIFLMLNSLYYVS